MNKLNNNVCMNFEICKHLEKGDWFNSLKMSVLIKRAKFISDKDQLLTPADAMKASILLSKLGVKI